MGQMLTMLQKLVLSRLNTLTHFKHDDAIRTTIEQLGSAEDIHDAEKIVLSLMEEWGQVLLGGDLLTVERIQQNKNLRLSNLSHFERLGFLGSPRIAVFHLKQNIILKLVAKLLPNLEDSDNPGTLNAFRALTERAKDLSNKESKIKDELELHYQFLVAVSEVYLEAKVIKEFGNLTKCASSMKGKNEDEVISMLEIITKGSKVFFEEEEVTEKPNGEDTDDLKEMGNVFVGVWFLLKSLDFITKTGDGKGIMLYKKNAILLTLSLHSSLSKYVHQLFQELLEVQKMSDRERMRFASGHFIKYHPRQSSGLELKPQDLNLRSEDMVCEWCVAKVKNNLKSLGGNSSEETIEKKTKATALIDAILQHDNRSLLVDTSTGPGHSWDRFAEDELERFRDYVRKLNPFRLEFGSRGNPLIINIS